MAIILMSGELWNDVYRGKVKSVKSVLGEGTETHTVTQTDARFAARTGRQTSQRSSILLVMCALFSFRNSERKRGS